MKMELNPHGIINTPLPGLLKQLNQHAIMSRFSNCQMKLHITDLVIVRNCPLLLQLQSAAHFYDIFTGRL
ncbi:Uncharacterised protein [Citrobacter werkmanii]|uniref:Uncharacterized protein n=1 Tax=Citrobacter werkmanii TaxID=67827 RepID=A0A9N8CVT1_9ENTR|nr:Uncharacterised protein [Citrobacter werkmanii]SWK36903.1 Uncharacterised protein [Klebsiella pneumoniae]CAB5616227.1 Uncharacterised protein [Citrobacter werkmanii]CAB5628134.1 Uncharacterised protein [Citrobacter werkmanii]CAB5635219.1 Uncharacterised protein [Citrobacter werkmanii]